MVWFSHLSFSSRLLLAASAASVCTMLLSLYFHNRKTKLLLAHLSKVHELEKQGLTDRIEEKNGLHETLRRQYDQLFVEKTALAAENKTLVLEQGHAEGQLQQMVQLQEDIITGKKLTTELQDQLSSQKSVNATLETRLEQEKLRSEEQQDLLGAARDQLRLQFAELAQTILEEKSRHFSKDSTEKLGSLFVPFREQLSLFQKKIDAVHHSEIRDRAALQQEIQSLRTLNQRISEDAVNLTRALKGDRQLQGSWGELVLERVLQQSALRKGIEYETQSVHRDKNNRLQRPDVIVHLPENRDIVVDSKVSLSSWERYVSADNETEKQQFLRAHVKAVREHVKLLAKKDYGSLESIRSLDFVLMFMPVEAAFVTAFQEDDSLFDDAVLQKIILVSPTTLLASLKTVESIWRYERQSRNTREIAERAAALYDKFCSFAEDMEKMGKQLHTLQGSYDSSMTRLSRGRGNLISQIQRFPKLGVKVKKRLPESVSRRDDA